MAEVGLAQGLDVRIVRRAQTRGLVLFAVVRDEDYFLPHFFRHYRAIGIETFLIYDDRSGPATSDFLHAQPDCTILASEHTFGDVLGHRANGAPRRLPLVLKESLPLTLFPDRWVLTVDADEFLVLPTGVSDLAQLIDGLTRVGQPYLTAPMVDFYGETLNHRNYDRSLDPFEGNPFFDVGPYYQWTDDLAPVQFRVGVRWRLMNALHQLHPEDFQRIFPEGPSPPKVSKVPLLDNRSGIFRIADHEISIVPRADVAGALAHFKFYPDLDKKVGQAVSEGQYHDGSLQYRFLDASIRRFGDASLIAPESRRYTGPSALAEARLLTGAPSA